MSATDIDNFEWIETANAAKPSFTYSAGRTHDLQGNPIAEADNGQLQFHKAPHVIRTCAPGNGWGKSAVIAVEVEYWCHGTHPFPHEIPDRPVQCVWIAQKHQQWEFMKKVIHPWWPRSVVESWRGNPHFDYRWPNGSTLSIITSETDWKTVQGIEPDLVVGDEEIPAALAAEMLMRRRGGTKTRYVFNGTSTSGLTWMYRQLYVPWKQYHETRGIFDEREMMRRQMHDYGDIVPELAGLPGIWCWPKGGHYDNPTATPVTWAMYRANVRMFSPVVQDVRLHGGYREFNAQPVFNQEALQQMRVNLSPGELGWFVEVKEVRR